MGEGENHSGPLVQHLGQLQGKKQAEPLTTSSPELPAWKVESLKRGSLPAWSTELPQGQRKFLVLIAAACKHGDISKWGKAQSSHLRGQA